MSASETSSTLPPPKGCRVAQGAWPCAFVAVPDVGVRTPRLLDAVDEVAQVRPLHVPRLFAALDAVNDAPAAAVANQRAALAVQRHTERLPVEAGPRPDAV